MQMIDLTGKTFGRLTVINKTEAKHGQTKWLCRCDCGNEVEVYGSNLRTNKTKSCGSHTPDRHGESKTKLYRVYYSKRKVGLCEEWQTYDNFKAWALDHGYAEGTYIQRKDCTDIWTPENTFISESR